MRLVIATVSRTAKKSSTTRTRSKSRRWSGAVTRHSNALDLQPKVFRSTDPRRIALSLKRSAQASKRRKGTPYQSALSMLNFYINRAGKSHPQNVLAISMPSSISNRAGHAFQFAHLRRLFCSRPDCLLEYAFVERAEKSPRGCELRFLRRVETPHSPPCSFPRRQWIFGLADQSPRPKDAVRAAPGWLAASA